MTEQAVALVRRTGLGVPVKFEDLAGGSNNRVYRVLLESGSSCLLKSYFRDPADRRDRLGAEFAFLEFAWSRGIRAVPEPLASDAENGLGLYAFIEGRRVEPHEIDTEKLLQAADLVGALSLHRSSQEAGALPRGSEACFTMAEHFECISGRVSRLASIGSDTASERVALDFVRDQLEPAWTGALDQANQKMASLGLAPEAEISAPERCLSPSDFGFHNALVAEGGRVTFLDFEYAGWDDAAKMVCDFLCQPRVPVPPDLGALFTQAVARYLGTPPAFEARVDLLLPLFRLKWICIMLNEFLPAGKRRRQFARRDDLEGLKREQLAKARRALSEWR